MRLLVSSCVVAIALCLVVLPAVYRIGVTQGEWQAGVVACESNTTEPKRRK
jgi:hypothetical protein